MPPSVVVGLATALTSCVCNGSSVVCWRLRRVQDTKIHPIVYSIYILIGHLLVALLLVLAGARVTLSPVAMIGGALIVVSCYFALLAVSSLGVVVAEPMWCATATLTSFVWGKGVFGEPVRSVGWCVGGLLFVVGGMLGVIVSRRIADGRAASACLDKREREPLVDKASAPKPAGAPESAGAVPSQLATLLPIVTGLTGGSTLVPQHYLTDLTPIDYAVSFALANAICALLLLGGFAAVQPAQARHWAPAACALPGIAHGVIWEVGNVGSMVAAASPLGLALAQPIREAGFFVGMAWGVCLFGEVRGAALAALIASGCVVLSGIALLASLGS